LAKDFTVERMIAAPFMIFLMSGRKTLKKGSRWRDSIGYWRCALAALAA
jgi:hypothetical protein